MSIRVGELFSNPLASFPHLRLRPIGSNTDNIQMSLNNFSQIPCQPGAEGPATSKNLIQSAKKGCETVHNFFDMQSHVISPFWFMELGTDHDHELIEL